jgi:hypothetical protein
MDQALMIERIRQSSPRLKARIAGVFEALEGLTSSWGQVFVLGKFIVSGNAAATAANILANERLFWLGFISSLIGVICHIVWVFLFYELFKPVNRSISLLAAFVGIVVCGLQALTALLYVAPLLILQGGSALSGFTTDQLHALAYAFIRLNGYAFDVDLVFFGLWCILSGYLIYKSTFLPRILGVLLVIDGIGWMTFMLPPFATQIFTFIAIASGAAEIPLQLWLLIMGVNPERWKAQAIAAGEY